MSSDFVVARGHDEYIERDRRESDADMLCDLRLRLEENGRGKKPGIPGCAIMMLSSR